MGESAPGCKEPCKKMTFSLLRLQMLQCPNIAFQGTKQYSRQDRPRLADQHAHFSRHICITRHFRHDIKTLFLNILLKIFECFKQNVSYIAPFKTQQNPVAPFDRIFLKKTLLTFLATNTGCLCGLASDTLFIQSSGTSFPLYTAGTLFIYRGRGVCCPR